MPGKKKSTTTSDIIQIIKEHYDGLSDSHQKVANYVLENLEAATLLTVSGLAERIGTSDATLIRFAQELGFAGYKDMREQMADYIRKIIYAKKPSLENQANGKNLIQKTKDLDIAYISRTMDEIDQKRFSELVKQIAKSKRIYCMGWRISSFLAEFLAFQFKRLGLEAYPIVRERRSFLEQVLDLKKGDLLVVFDMLLYSTEVYEAVSYVGRKKPEIKIATFTNDPLAQIVQYSDLPFFLDLSGQRDFSIISLSAPMCLINAIVEEIIALDPQKANESLSLYEKEVLTRSNYAKTSQPKV